MKLAPATRARSTLGASAPIAVLLGLLSVGVSCAQSQRALGEECLKDQDCLSGICSQLTCAAAPQLLDGAPNGPSADAQSEDAPSETEAASPADASGNADATPAGDATAEAGPPSEAGVGAEAGADDGTGQGASEAAAEASDDAPALDSSAEPQDSAPASD